MKTAKNTNNNFVKLEHIISNYDNETFDDILNSIKRVNFFKRQNINIRKIFWNSELPVKFFTEILDCALSHDLLVSYFGSINNSNPKFNKLLTSKPKVLIKYFKYTRCLLNDEWQKQFHFISSRRNQELKITYREFKYIQDIFSRYDEDEIDFLTTFEKYPIEKVLIHVISYYEKFKRSSIKARNRDLMISHETVLISAFNEILSKYINGKTKKLHTLHNNSVQDITLLIEDILPPINPIEGLIEGKYLPIENISEEKKELRTVFEFYFQKQITLYHIDKYLNNYADFSSIYELEAEITTNTQYRSYKINDLKNKYLEYYTMNKVGFMASGNSAPKNKTSVSLEYFKTLHLPIEYMISKNNSIDFEKIFCLLNSFSFFISPQGRQIAINQNKTINIKNEVPENFTKLFGTQYIQVFTEDELITNISSYFNWDKDEVKNMVSFLTTDIKTTKAKEEIQVNITTRPFIKVGKHYFWFSSFLKERKWSVLMQNRLMLTDYRDKNQPSQTALEKDISVEFEKNKFSVVSSYNYEDDEIKGEFDGLCYKDGYLFVIELKVTSVIESIDKSNTYFENKINKLAKHQIIKGIKYIEQNFSTIQEILNIKKSLDEITIIPMIITNTFDHDKALDMEGIFVLSSLELFTILRNDLKSVQQIELPGVSKTNNQNYKLWSGSNCSPKDLIDAIKENKVWNFLDAIVEFHPHTETIKPYDKMDLNLV